MLTVTNCSRESIVCSVLSKQYLLKVSGFRIFLALGMFLEKIPMGKMQVSSSFSLTGPV